MMTSTVQSRVISASQCDSFEMLGEFRTNLSQLSLGNSFHVVGACDNSAGSPESNDKPRRSSQVFGVLTPPTSMQGGVQLRT